MIKFGEYEEGVGAITPGSRRDCLQNCTVLFPIQPLNRLPLPNILKRWEVRWLQLLFWCGSRLLCRNESSRMPRNESGEYKLKPLKNRIEQALILMNIHWLLTHESLALQTCFKWFRDFRICFDVRLFQCLLWKSMFV